MLFNSYQFLCLFLPITLATTFVIARRAGPTPAQDWLALTSLAFYGTWNLQFLPLLLSSILLNYAAARALIRIAEPRRRSLLIATITINLALLGYYKYANFFLDTLDHITGEHFSLPAILLPLGISFYTFQQITLLVDVSQGRIERFRFRDFLLFVTFFPHLIAGPIVHHREMMPQFERASYRFDPSNLAVGLTLFIGGLFKKTILADGIAVHVSPLFQAAATGTPLTLLDAWAAALGFMLQMYFDFSGYSEMALGLARMVGITLPMNFNSPLKARNVIDYWARWHITLTRFLTAYVYNPIATAAARARAAKGLRGIAGLRTTPGAFLRLIAFPTLATMFLSGLWHGAGNQYVVFGLLHGAYLVICHAWRLARPRIFPNTPRYDRITHAPAVALTLVATTIALTFFRADTVTTGTKIVAGMAGLHGTAVPTAIFEYVPTLGRALVAAGVTAAPTNLATLATTYAWLLTLLAIALAAPNLLQLLRDQKPALTLPAPYPAIGWQLTRPWAVLTAAAALAGILSLGQTTEFLYWQF